MLVIMATTPCDLPAMQSAFAWFVPDTKKAGKNYLVAFVNDIFALPNIRILIPTYLLIFPEKNHGILAGKYDLLSGMIRVEANSYHKRFRSFVVKAKLFVLCVSSQHPVCLQYFPHLNEPC
jgi:hypothetical protein